MDDETSSFDPNAKTKEEHGHKKVLVHEAGVFLSQLHAASSKVRPKMGLTSGNLGCAPFIVCKSSQLQPYHQIHVHT